MGHDENHAIEPFIGMGTNPKLQQLALLALPLLSAVVILIHKGFEHLLRVPIIRRLWIALSYPFRQFITPEDVLTEPHFELSDQLQPARTPKLLIAVTWTNTATLLLLGIEFTTEQLRLGSLNITHLSLSWLTVLIWVPGFFIFRPMLVFISFPDRNFIISHFNVPIFSLPQTYLGFIGDFHFLLGTLSRKMDRQSRHAFVAPQLGTRNPFVYRYMYHGNASYAKDQQIFPNLSVHSQ